MQEKVSNDEECDGLVKRNRCRQPKLRTLFCHTISSKNRAKEPISAPPCECCDNRDKISSKGKKKKVSIISNNNNSRPRACKLERRGKLCCDADEKTKETDNCCPHGAAVRRPQTSWVKQRDDYLDRITWTTGNCAKTVECPAYAAYLERVERKSHANKSNSACTDPTCSCNDATRSTEQCDHHQRNTRSAGRRRHPEIQPTIPDSKSCRSRPSSCSPTRRKSPEQGGSGSCDRKREERKCPCDEDADKPIAARKRSQNALEGTCTKETCPNYRRGVTTSSWVCPPERIQSSNACPDATTQEPRVNARFENGVLEAYSQFKVVFPSAERTVKTTSTRRVQTDVGSTKDCAVPANRRCPSKRNVRVGCTDVDFADETLNQQSNRAQHDYVLLTPGGKYVPLVKTRSEGNERIVFRECCVDGSCSRVPPHDGCPDCASVRDLQDKEAQGCAAGDDKDDPTTTKLLLRCLEHMLNLEQQDGKAKCTGSDSRKDVSCKQGKAKEHRRDVLRLSDKPSCANCAGASEPRPTGNCSKCCPNRCSPRGKLAQNFLEILKCALELDDKRENRGKDDDDDDDGQDCCDCDVVGEKNARPDGKYEKDGTVRFCSKERSDSRHCETIENRNGMSTATQDFLSGVQSTDRNSGSACQEIPITRENERTPSPGFSKLRPNAVQHASEDKNSVLQKSSKQQQVIKTIDGSCGNRYPLTSTAQAAGVREKIPYTSKETQYSARQLPGKFSIGTQKRDTVLEYLVKRATSRSSYVDGRCHTPTVLATGLPRDTCAPGKSRHPTEDRSPDESFEGTAEDARNMLGCDDDNNAIGDARRVNYQFYRSFVMRNPAERSSEEQGGLKQYHRRICGLKKVYEPGY